jgi:hypothetical protein
MKYLEFVFQYYLSFPAKNMDYSCKLCPSVFVTNNNCTDLDIKISQATKCGPTICQIPLLGQLLRFFAWIVAVSGMKQQYILFYSVISQRNLLE